ncbi:MAG: VanZ family protein, partial [Candidatus Omnitrophota bacterium]
SFIFSILYAISDEIHQTFIPGRNASVKDVVADCVGILIGLYIVKKWQR